MPPSIFQHLRRHLLRCTPGSPSLRIAALASALAVGFICGCTGSTSTHQANGSTPSAAPSPVSFPSRPPDAAQCPGTILDHRDIKHPDLGAVRVFLIRRTDTDTLTGCIASVTGSGRVLKSIGVEIYENELKFADPVSDATKNTFVIYNPGRYDGVVVLVPNETGYEDIAWTDPEAHYRGGRLAHYNARLVGPGEDGRYTVVKSENSCNPSCADGSISQVVLHWNGHDYLPAQ
ncbi:hypothetical protein [Streptomyces sp. S.PB5]|uniref:hypothetical protein n=1 Tax=Streptomyces sp. S.PB5 TaxID=3020844 RepID=UPI0025AEE9A3|nr:hypothetical protein [Streptomyces sp. S.PB5]MDN3026317.1 hypothetical protein [Streptomyces sp. S.PB5]